jgi:putative peptidoglycan lipid II flippase
MLCAAGVITVFAAGYVYQEETEKIYLATQMLRITFPYLLLISLTAFAGAILNTFGRFAVPAFTPVLLNVSLIVSAIWLRPYFDFPVLALAWGVLIAGIIQLVFQLPFLARLGLLPRPKVDLKHSGVRKIFRLMVPALFGVSVGQINLLLDTVLATFLITGSLSWLYYSDRLLELPLALFGITIATVILPSLSGKFVAKSTEAFSETLDWAVKMVLLLGIPASLALIYLSDILIATLFFNGAMTVVDIEMAGLSLKAYGAGLAGHMLVKVLAPGYFARQDTKTPVKIGLIALCFNMLLNLMLIAFLGHVGLALATSASAFLNAFLLWRGLRLQGIYHAAEGWVYFTGRLLISVAAMALFLIWFTPDLSLWLTLSNIDRVKQLLVICLLGALVYFLSMVAMGMRLRDFRR